MSGTKGINLTNCCFGGKDGKTLFITDSLEGNVQCVEWHCKGATPVPTVASKSSDEAYCYKKQTVKREIVKQCLPKWISRMASECRTVSIAEGFKVTIGTKHRRQYAISINGI